MRTEQWIVVTAMSVLLSVPLHAETITVQMKNIGYEPASISARVGDTIVWVNNDIVGHTATARDKSWDLNILPKKSAKLVIKKAGDVEYYCRFHPNMVGHIKVSD
jgi:plastocyanin